MEFLVVVTILLALIDRFVSAALPHNGIFECLIPKKKTRFASSDRSVLMSSPQASISHSRSSKVYKEAAVGQSWADASMVE